MALEFTDYLRKPFVVSAIEITEENIHEVAKFVGTIRQKDDGTPYIQVDRVLIPNVDFVYPGYFMTRMGKNVRCYSPKVFSRQFTHLSPEAQAWIDHINQKDTPTEEVPVVETSTVVDL